MGWIRAGSGSWIEWVNSLPKWDREFYIEKAAKEVAAEEAAAAAKAAARKAEIAAAEEAARPIVEAADEKARIRDAYIAEFCVRFRLDEAEFRAGLAAFYEAEDAAFCGYPDEDGRDNMCARIGCAKSDMVPIFGEW